MADNKKSVLSEEISYVLEQTRESAIYSAILELYKYSTDNLAETISIDKAVELLENLVKKNK